MRVKFRWEADLVALTKDNIGLFLPPIEPHEEVVCYPELQVRSGIADLVAGVINTNLLYDLPSQDNGVILERGIWWEFFASILNHTHIDCDELINAGVSHWRKYYDDMSIMQKKYHDKKQYSSNVITKQYRQGLYKMVQAGYLRVNDNRPFDKASTFEGMTLTVTNLSKIVRHVTAIEAKLSNWKKVLYQAHINTLFSNYSYVVMDKYHVKPIERNLDKFSSKGIGVAIGCASTNIVEIISPAKQANHSEVSLIRGWQHILSKLIEERSSGINGNG